MYATKKTVAIFLKTITARKPANDVPLGKLPIVGSLRYHFSSFFHSSFHSQFFHESFFHCSFRDLKPSLCNNCRRLITISRSLACGVKGLGPSIVLSMTLGCLKHAMGYVERNLGGINSHEVMEEEE